MMKNSNLLIFTFLIIISCKNEPQNLVKIEGKLIQINEKITSKKEIEALITPYKEKVEAEMNTAISYTPKDLSNDDGELESSLGNLMADMCYERANPVFNSRTGNNIDFTLLNFGGIRAGITKGTITNKNAFRLMPFENSLVVVELSYDKVTELIQYLIKHHKAHPVSKQVRLIISKDGSNYQFSINNKPLDASKTYYVLTHDYLQNGGDNMNFFKDPINLYNLDYKVRNAIIDYFKENDTIKVELDGRFKKEE